MRLFQQPRPGIATGDLDHATDASVAHWRSRASFEIAGLERQYASEVSVKQVTAPVQGIITPMQGVCLTPEAPAPDMTVSRLIQKQVSMCLKGSTHAADIQKRQDHQKRQSRQIKKLF